MIRRSSFVRTRRGTTPSVRACCRAADVWEQTPSTASTRRRQPSQRRTPAETSRKRKQYQRDEQIIRKGDTSPSGVIIYIIYVIRIVPSCATNHPRYFSLKSCCLWTGGYRQFFSLYRQLSNAGRSVGSLGGASPRGPPLMNSRNDPPKRESPSEGGPYDQERHPQQQQLTSDAKSTCPGQSIRFIMYGDSTPPPGGPSWGLPCSLVLGGPPGCEGPSGGTLKQSFGGPCTRTFTGAPWEPPGTPFLRYRRETTLALIVICLACSSSLESKKRTFPAEASLTNPFVASNRSERDVFPKHRQARYERVAYT